MFSSSSRIKISISLLLIASLALTIPAGARSADRLPALASTVPTVVFPTGTLPISRLVYIWTAVSGAAEYEYQAVQGTSLILNQVLASAACVSTTCSVVAPSDLANGSYNWRVRARIGGVNQAYSPWQAFTVSLTSEPAGFISLFTSDAAGWVAHKGTWTLQNSNYYTTNGVAAKASTISHVDNYSTLTFEARMLRSGCAGCANTLAIRGNPVLDATGWWNTEYTFDYTNTGLFSVWKDYNGSYTALKNWTTTSAIVQGGWNTLKVTASGSSLKFYINGTLVWSGTDSAYSSGRVGIGMYRSSTSTGDKLSVDWAQLDLSVAALSLNTPELIPEDQVEVPGGNHNRAP